MLGLVQGPAELLPVSSSGHIALIAWLAGWERDELDPALGKSFEIALHAGTAIALPIVMRGELSGALGRLGRRGAASLSLSMLAPALLGYAFERPIERRLSAPKAVSAGLIAGALAMALVDRRASERGLEELVPGDGLALGLAQAIALAPGISRNGATLAMARLRGFDRGDADALSWLAALPVIYGAGALKGARVIRRGVPSGAGAPLFAGIASSFCSTLAAGRFLRRRGRSPGALLPYSIYRCAVALLVIRRLHNRRRNRPGSPRAAGAAGGKGTS